MTVALQVAAAAVLILSMVTGLFSAWLYGRGHRPIEAEVKTIVGPERYGEVEDERLNEHPSMPAWYRAAFETVSRREEHERHRLDIGLGKAGLGVALVFAVCGMIVLHNAEGIVTWLTAGPGPGGGF